MGEHITELNSKNFDKLTSKGKWAIDFWASWCGPCVMLKPVFEAVSNDLHKDVNFGKVDIDSEQELAERFQVMSIPTILFLKDGEYVDSNVGLVNKDTLAKKIKETF